MSGRLCAVRDLIRERMAGLPLTNWGGVRSGFILSTGRTGTQRLAEVIGQVTDGVVVLHEPHPDLFYIGEAVARGTLSQAEARRRLRRARQPICNRLKWSGVRHYVESNNNLAYLPKAIRTVFDAPRFIHIVRDGRDVVRSLYSKAGPSRRPGRTGAGRRDALFLDHDDARCRLAAVDFPDDPSSSEWHRMSRFERTCWHWAGKNALIREALGSAEDALTLRFEDIFDERSGFPGFWEMIDFLGLSDRMVRSKTEVRELLASPSNESAAFLIPSPDRWDGALNAAFERFAGPEQRMYYG